MCRKNVTEGVEIQKHFISGHYVIREIYCVSCSKQVGWKYVSQFCRYTLGRPLLVIHVFLGELVSVRESPQCIHKDPMSSCESCVLLRDAHEG